MSPPPTEKAHLRLETWQVAIAAVGLLITIYFYRRQTTPAPSSAASAELPQPTGVAGSSGVGGGGGGIPNEPPTAIEPRMPANGEQTARTEPIPPWESQHEYETSKGKKLGDLAIERRISQQNREGTRGLT